jgi:hypothetical protein
MHAEIVNVILSDTRNLLQYMRLLNTVGVVEIVDYACCCIQNPTAWRRQTRCRRAEKNAVFISHTSGLRQRARLEKATNRDGCKSLLTKL